MTDVIDEANQVMDTKLNQSFSKDIKAKINLKISEKLRASQFFGNNGDLTLKLTYEKNDKIHPYFKTETNYLTNQFTSLFGARFWRKNFEGNFVFQFDDKATIN